MRDIINIIEAASRKREKPHPRPMDFGTLKTEVMQLATVLKQEPFGVVFDRAIANMLIEKMKEIKADYEHHEDEIIPSNSDVLENVFQRYWKGNFHLSFFEVRKELSSEHDSYQDRAAERHGFGDDISQYIEDSNWLRGMAAQEKCAGIIDSCMMKPDVTEVPKMVAAIQDFIRTYYENLHVTDDDGEQPIMLSNFYNGLAELMPILILMVSVQN